MQLKREQEPVTYGAVGATRDPELLRFPPQGYRAVQASARIGHGAERFQRAAEEALRWGIQRRSGFEVVIDDRPEGAAGDPLLPGDSVTLTARILGVLRLRSPLRVVYLVDEPEQRGFAVGTLAGHQVEGEECFLIQQRADGTVWLTIRAFSRPAGRRWRGVAWLLRIGQWVVRRRYLWSLAGRLGD